MLYVGKVVGTYVGTLLKDGDRVGDLEKEGCKVGDRVVGLADGARLILGARVGIGERVGD